MWHRHSDVLGAKRCKVNECSSNSDEAPPCRSAHESLGTEMAHYKVFCFADTLDLPPEIAMTKQRYFVVWVCMHLLIIILKYYLFILQRFYGVSYLDYIFRVSHERAGAVQVTDRNSWHLGHLFMAAWNASILLGGTGEDLRVACLLTQRSHRYIAIGALGRGVPGAHTHALDWSNLVRK